MMGDKGLVDSGGVKGYQIITFYEDGPFGVGFFRYHYFCCQGERFHITKEARC